jgi:hypothetical protein
MNVLKKILAPLSIFFIFFIVILKVYSPVGPIIDGDSPSYTYFIHFKQIDYQRPPAYPALLFLINSISPYPTTQFFTKLFIVQTILISLSALFGFLTLHKLTKHAFMSFLVTVLGVFYIPLIKYVNYLNPEILLTFFITLMCYLSINIEAFKSKTNLAIFITIASLSTLTKPIMLYSIFIVLIFFLLLFIARCITKRTLLFSFGAMLLIWLLPIVTWSYGNITNYQVFTYSKIQEVAILGKLISYNMLDLGPENINNIPIKSLLLASSNSDIWSRLAKITNQNIYSYQPLSNAIFSYGRKVILKNQ